MTVVHFHHRGLPVRVTENVQEGAVYQLGATLVVAPLTAWSLRHEGRYPLLSRYSRGMLERDRDRRRHPAPPECLFCRREAPCECAGGPCMCTCGRCRAPLSEEDFV